MIRLPKSKHIEGIRLARENGLAALPGIDLWFGSGNIFAASHLPESYMKALQERYAKCLVWDIPPESRLEAFAHVIGHSPHVGYAQLDDDAGTPLGISWAFPSSDRARCAEIHFSFNDRRMPLARAATLAFMAYLQKHYDALFGMIPASFRHAIKFGESLGFKKTARLKNACWIENRKHHEDGIVVYKEF